MVGVNGSRANGAGSGMDAATDAAHHSPSVQNAKS
jgi:hypothetical protein